MKDNISNKDILSIEKCGCQWESCEFSSHSMSYDNTVSFSRKEIEDILMERIQNNEKAIKHLQDLLSK